MRRSLITVFAALVCVLVTMGWAAVSPYSQDFEGLSMPSDGALLGDGWLVFGNVFDGGGGYLYGYGPFAAPNDGAAFCAVVSGEGGPDQGSQQLSVFSDYNNDGHASGYLIETNVFQEQVIEAADTGMTWVFTFDAKLGNLEGGSEAEAFIKTLDPDAGYATTNLFSVDMTSIPTTWGSHALQITIDGGLAGQILQFGFTTRATNYEGSGIFYDNLRFQVYQPPAGATLVKSSSFNPAIHDYDNTGTLTGGDTLVYRLSVTNNDSADALGLVVEDVPDPNTAVTIGTVTTTNGTVTSGNGAGDSVVSVSLGVLSGGASAIIEFEVTLDDPLPAGVTEIQNQASLRGPEGSTIDSATATDIIGAALGRHPIPTLSTWSMLLFALLIAGGAVLRLRS